MIADCRFFGEVGEWKGLKEIVGMRRGLGTGRVRNLPAMSRFTPTNFRSVSGYA